MLGSSLMDNDKDSSRLKFSVNRHCTSHCTLTIRSENYFVMWKHQEIKNTTSPEHNDSEHHAVGFSFSSVPTVGLPLPNSVFLMFHWVDHEHLVLGFFGHFISGFSRTRSMLPFFIHDN